MAFRAVSGPVAVPATPLELFDEIPRKPGSIPELWRPQADLLRAYTPNFVDQPDVAFELPTGTGKTMVGLLATTWRRMKFGKPVVYACPTKQLAYQVAEVARREQIAAVTLVDSHRNWYGKDQAAYESAEAIALTSYSGIFNTSPKFGEPGTILFDDAHAAEQYVAEAWTIHIQRRNPAYDAILDVVATGLDGMFVQRLKSPTPDIGTKRDVRLVIPSRYDTLSTRLDRALAQLPEKSPEWWQAQMVRSGLNSCQVYVSWRSISIRPFIPPTSECRPFTYADQRIYLSATLGHAGELNRAFGRESIKRVPLPEDSRAPRSGRRYFVFSDLTDVDPLQVAQTAATAAGKTLVLARSTTQAVEVANKINVAGSPLFTKDDIATTTETFAKAPKGVLALAGRYDGIDLPGDACRLVVLQGLPELPHLQEQFLANNLRARAALEERTRTRVAQGAGRATRSPNDHAIVLVQGTDLMRYLTNNSRIGSLDVDLQAEVYFGAENSEKQDLNEIRNNIDMFLEQGDAWHTGAEPHLREVRARLNRVPIDGEAKLAASAPHEVIAAQCAWRGDYVGARTAAQAAAHALSGEEKLRSYRSFWTYLAAVYSFAATASDANAKRTGTGLLADAHKAAKGTTWLRETDPGDVPVEQVADDLPALKRIAETVAHGVTRNKVGQTFDTIDAGLIAVEHQKSEPALTELGKWLGSDAGKPGGQARADSVWCWAEQIWIAIEAKTEQNPDQPLPVKDVRQANTQLKFVAEDRGVAMPDLVADIIVSPRTNISPDATTAADPWVYLSHPTEMRALSSDARDAWIALLLRHKGHEGDDLRELIRTVFGEHRCLPSQVLQRLTLEPVSG